MNLRPKVKIPPPTIGMRVAYWEDQSKDHQGCSATVKMVISRDTLDIELPNGERRTANYAGPSSAPRPPGSWDFIV